MASQAVLSRDAEEFLSYLAVEKGRAPASISAYRHDLVAYEEFLSERGLTLSQADVGVIESYVALLGACRRPSSTARALAAVRGVHRFCVDERGATVDPDRRRLHAPDPPGHPEGPLRGRSRALVVSCDRGRSAGVKRQGDPRDPLRHRHADLRAFRAAPRRSRHGQGARPCLRQGLQGTSCARRPPCSRRPRSLARTGRSTGHGPGALRPAGRRGGRVHLHPGKGACHARPCGRWSAGPP